MYSIKKNMFLLILTLSVLRVVQGVSLYCANITMSSVKDTSLKKFLINNKNFNDDSFKTCLSTKIECNPFLEFDFKVNSWPICGVSLKLGNYSVLMIPIINIYDNENVVKECSLLESTSLVIRFKCVDEENECLRGRYISVNLKRADQHNCLNKRIEICKIKVFDLTELLEIDSSTCPKQTLAKFGANILSTSVKNIINKNNKRKKYADQLQARFGKWNDWTDFTATCGLAAKMRLRTCYENSTDAITLPISDLRCKGNLETQFKDLGACYNSHESIDQWSPWSTCRGTCLEQSSMIRSRKVCSGNWLLNKDANTKCVPKYKKIDNFDEFEGALECIDSMKSGKQLNCDGYIIEEN